jgi:putative FmdB family regulatory protein
MPLYDYHCSNCGQTTEVMHGIEAPGPRFCPACGAEGTLRKAFATPAVHFKGSGWAKKDRSSSSGSRSKSGTDNASSGDSAGGSQNGGGTTKPTPSTGESTTAAKTAGSSED